MGKWQAIVGVSRVFVNAGHPYLGFSLATLIVGSPFMAATATYLLLR